MGIEINTKQLLIAEHKLDIGNFSFYKNVIVGEFSEGVHVTHENAIVPIQIATQLYGSKEPIIYISHRKYSYSMDPVGYKETVALFPNFIAFGIVTQNKRTRMLANLERLFIKRPIRLFNTLDEALVWAEEFLLNEPKL